MPDPSLSVRSQEEERKQRVEDRKENEFGDFVISRASRSRTQQPAQEQVQEQEEAAADEESEESDEGGTAVLLGHLLIRSE